VQYAIVVIEIASQRRRRKTVPGFQTVAPITLQETKQSSCVQSWQIDLTLWRKRLLRQWGSAVRNRCYGNCLAKTAALLTQKIPFSFIKKNFIRKSTFCLEFQKNPITFVIRCNYFIRVQRHLNPNSFRTICSISESNHL
jgi:hypothetical protein